MKKYVSLIAFLALLFLASSAFAGMNRCPEWLGKPSLNAEAKGPIAAIYNPAGLPHINDGLYIHFGDMMAAKTYTAKTGGTESESDDPVTAFVPDVILAFKKNNTAAFFTYTIAGGGGKVTYDSNTKTEAAIHEFSLGASHALFDGMLSLSGGFRTLYLKADTEAGGGTVKIDAYAFQGFFGLNLMPIKGLILSATYETLGTYNGRVNASGTKAAVLSTTGLTAIGGNPREQSARLLTGIGYQILDNLNMQLSYTIEFTKEDKMGVTTIRNDEKNLGHRIGLGADYTIIKLIKIMAGLEYSINGDTEDSLSLNPAAAFDPGLDALTIGVGVGVIPLEYLEINAAFAKPIYFEKENSAGTKFNKNVWTWGFSIQYKVHGTY